jgi:hypothetical protein
MEKITCRIQGSPEGDEEGEGIRAVLVLVRIESEPRLNIVLEHDLIRKPVPILDQVEDKLFGIML